MPMSKNPLSKNEPGVATFCGRQIGEDLLDFFLLPFLLSSSSSSSSSSSAELLFSMNPLSKSELPQLGVVTFHSFFFLGEASLDFGEAVFDLDFLLSFTVFLSTRSGFSSLKSKWFA